MTITELTKRIKESSRNRTPEESFELLQKAHILDSDGYYSERFFSKETVERDRANSRGAER